MSDFDGTLSDIHPNPNLTDIKPESKNALDELVTRPNMMIAIISGRPVKNLKTKVEIDNATYAGNHGMEMLFPNQTEWKYPITAEMYKNCTKIRKILLTEVGIRPDYGFIIMIITGIYNMVIRFIYSSAPRFVADGSKIRAHH